MKFFAKRAVRDRRGRCNRCKNLIASLVGGCALSRRTRIPKSMKKKSSRSKPAKKKAAAKKKKPVTRKKSAGKKKFGAMPGEHGNG
jgi:hypothetical protein